MEMKFTSHFDEYSQPIDLYQGPLLNETDRDVSKLAAFAALLAVTFPVVDSLQRFNNCAFSQASDSFKDNSFTCRLPVFAQVLWMAGWAAILNKQEVGGAIDGILNHLGNQDDQR